MRAHAAAMTAAAMALVCCSDETETVPVSLARCPNDLPVSGEACPEPGLVCHYFTGCVDFYPAACQTDLRWKVDDACVPPGAGGGGGAAGAAGR